MSHPPPAPHPRTARGLVLRALLGLALVLAGCSGSLRRTVRPAPELEIAAVAILPFGFRWEEPAFRSFELSQRLVATGLEQHGARVKFFGPDEFRVFRGPEGNDWASTDLVTRLPAASVRPDATVILRPWAERTLAEGQLQTVDRRGQLAQRSSSRELTLTGHVEIVHPSSGQVLVEVSDHLTVDPFASADAGVDPAPELTALMERLTRVALEALQPQLVAPPPAPLRLEGHRWALSPHFALRFASEGRPALTERLPAMDLLEGTLLRLARGRFANPQLDEASLARLDRLPAGLLILEAPPAAPLQPGDLILRVGGGPALPQVLARQLLSGGPLDLEVQRARGGVTTVTLH